MKVISLIKTLCAIVLVGTGSVLFGMDNQVPNLTQEDRDLMKAMALSLKEEKKQREEQQKSVSEQLEQMRAELKKVQDENAQLRKAQEDPMEAIIKYFERGSKYAAFGIEQLAELLKTIEIVRSLQPEDFDSPSDRNQNQRR